MLDPRGNDYMRRLHTRLNTFSSGRLDRDWFRKQYNKGRCPHFLVQKINGISEIMQDIFPDQWELQAWPMIVGERGDKKVFPMFVVKFDELEISNNNGDSLTLEDLYVAIEFAWDRSTPYIKAISGTRGKICGAEYDHGYLHSHLTTVSTSSVQSFHSFCLGDEGISQTMMMLNANWSYELFRMMCLQLNDYVYHESLEGGPHFKIENVYERGDPYPGHRLTPSILKPILDEVDKKLNQEDITITGGSGAYRIISNDRFKDKLKEIVPSRYLILQSINGDTYRADSVINRRRRNIPTHITWNGEALGTIKVTDRKIDPIEGATLVDPDLITRIKKHLLFKLQVNLLTHEPNLT